MAQISLATTSKHKPEEVIAKVKQMFADELGLEIKEEADCCIRLEGGGGFVFIQAESKQGKTIVSLEGSEWTAQLKDFMKKISG